MYKLSEEYKGRVLFQYIDVDKYGDISQEYQVSGIPDVRLFSGSKEVAKVVGANVPAITELL